MKRDDNFYREGRDRLRFMENFLFDCGYPGMNSYVRFIREDRDWFSKCKWRRSCQAKSEGSGFCSYHYQIALIRHYVWMRLVVKFKPSVYQPRQIKLDYSHCQPGAWKLDS